MNEFIVWDKKRKEWIHDENHSIHLFGETIIFGEILRRKDDSHVRLEDLNNIEAFGYIGKTDINDKKIYANSSIVEFEFQSPSMKQSRKRKGYFTYNKTYLRYDLMSISGNGIDFDIESSCNFKITGTLQKDKDLL